VDADPVDRRQFITDAGPCYGWRWIIDGPSSENPDRPSRAPPASGAAAIVERSMTIIDTHVHLIYMQRLEYPWLAADDALRGNHTYETYARQARRLGISAALHMEVDVAEEDIEKETTMIAHLASQLGSLLSGAISGCRPENRDFPDFLERQLSNPIVKGLRRVLHVVPDDLSTSTTFRENIRRLGGTGLTFDLCVFPHQHRTVLDLVDLAPDVTFVLDHCGVPDIKAEALDPWREGVAKFAERPNVMVKISGVVAYADPENWTVGDLRPYVEHVIDAFGWNRVVWGSDWPVVTLGGHLAEWVGATHELIAGCSDDERTALLSGNARRIWGL
jgi:predicted TIM-barrel fold metal-dependent hydrolase